MSMDPELQVFVEECDELLGELDSGLLACEQGAGDDATINGIFRAAHTIKGSAGLFGLDFIVSFVHELETALDQVRRGSVPMTKPLAVVLLTCSDHVRTLVESVKQGARVVEPGVVAAGHELIAKLKLQVGSTPNGATQETVGGSKSEASPSRIPEHAAFSAATADWHISVRFSADVLRNGMDPLSFLRYLNTFGEIVALRVMMQRLQPGAEWDPESCYIGFELRYRASVEESRIAGAFDFVREDCTLAVLSPHSPVQRYIEALERSGDKPIDYQVLVELGTLTAAELAAAQQVGRTEAALAQVAVEVKPAKASRASDSGSSEARTIRIDSTKLDNLITLVGELIIAAASTQLGARRTRDIELQESASQLAALVEEVRDSALQLRMVRIGATFNRFHRVVSDTARELGKDIRLVVTGEDTELDKTVVEKIGDPLTHLVRNAIDHGIGTPAERIAQGRPAQGTVTLNAYHDSGHIVIEVGDDGNGLNRERILAKAVERGLVPAGSQLSEKEIHSLIFEPGFSTAERVTNISGRGVGMDVVKRNITALRGAVEVRSAPGQGTTFVIRLPLTLAIINGFQVGVGKSVFVVPLEMVDECIEFSSENGHDFANVRGTALPFVRLNEVLALQQRAGARQNIVVVKSGGQRAGLVVDSLLGECQTVIKPLSKVFQNARCVSGSSILGNGEVALILDVPALVQHAIDATGEGGKQGSGSERSPLSVH